MDEWISLQGAFDTVDAWRPDLVARRQHPPPGRVVAIRHGLTETARRARVHIGETAVCFRPTISSAFGLTAAATMREEKMRTKGQVSAGGVVVRGEGDAAEVVLVSVGPQRRWQLPKGLVEPGEQREPGGPLERDVRRLPSAGSIQVRRSGHEITEAPKCRATRPHRLAFELRFKTEGISFKVDPAIDVPDPEPFLLRYRSGLLIASELVSKILKVG